MLGGEIGVNGGIWEEVHRDRSIVLVIFMALLYRHWEHGHVGEVGPKGHVGWIGSVRCHHVAVGRRTGCVERRSSTAGALRIRM
jgi:hypothetical protein